MLNENMKRTLELQKKFIEDKLTSDLEKAKRENEQKQLVFAIEAISIQTKKHYNGDVFRRAKQC